MSVSPRQFKSTAYGHIARVAKALASPVRLELLETLCQGPRTVEVLARQVGISIANASHHLRLLHQIRLVDTVKRGLFVEYRVADERVGTLLHLTREVAKSRLAEIRAVTEAFLKSRRALEQISEQDLVRRVRRGEVIVLDVRPAEEYDAGHIPGSRSIPLAELERRMTELPKGRAIVAYCRGAYCVMSVEAVQKLRDAGYEAHRMEQGVIEWRARGWRVQRAPSSSPAERRRA